MAEDIVKLPLSIIKESEYRDEETQLLVDKLNELSKPRYPDAVRVGLLGGSGSGSLSVSVCARYKPTHISTGKSSLINSLLGVANLAAQVSCIHADLYMILLTCRRATIPRV